MKAIRLIPIHQHDPRARRGRGLSQETSIVTLGGYSPLVSDGNGSTLTKLAGPALMLWSIQLIFRDFAFAFSHGSSELDTRGTFLGLRALDYALIWTPFALLAIIGLAGVYLAVAGAAHSWGRAGLIVAIVGVVLLFVSSVMQYWILDPVANFFSPLVMGGWVLSLVAYLTTSIGMLIAGLDIARSTALPRGRYLILSIGLLALPTLVVQSFVVRSSLDTVTWRLAFGAVTLPYDLCWLALGWVLLQTRQPVRRICQ